MGCDSHEWSEGSKEYLANRPLSMSIADKAAAEARLSELEDQVKALEKEQAIWNPDDSLQHDIIQYGDADWEPLTLIDPPERFKPQPLRSKLIWVGVDLDGTLAEPLWTPENPTEEIGDPIPDAILKVNQLVAQGYKVIVHTSRPWTDYQMIEQWLQHYNIPYKEIQCGKPLYAAYVDDRAINAREESWLPQ